MSDISPMTESIRLYAKQLRIPSFAKYNEILRHAGGGMGYEEFLHELMKKELEIRRENQQKRRTRAAGFPFLKTLDEFDYSRLLPRAEGTDIAEQNTLGSSILAFASLTCQGFASPITMPRALKNRYSKNHYLLTLDALDMT